MFPSVHFATPTAAHTVPPRPIPRRLSISSANSGYTESPSVRSPPYSLQRSTLVQGFSHQQPPRQYADDVPVNALDLYDSDKRRRHAGSARRKDSNDSTSSHRTHYSNPGDPAPPYHHPYQHNQAEHDYVQDYNLADTNSHHRGGNEHESPSHTMASNMKRKVVIMGAPSVGKTSLTQQYIAPPTYTEQYFPTIESTSHKLVNHDGIEYDCEIIDSAGQDEYTLFPPKYAVGVHGYLLVYSINSRQSFEMVQTIHDKILDFAGQAKVPCVIVGQKVDLAGERVTEAEGQALAKKLHAGFIETSAKGDLNVGKAFEVLLQEMRKEYNPKPEKKKSGWFGWGS